MNEGYKFARFAFRQLQRIPTEWQPHYKGLLLNGLQQGDFENHPNPYISSRPLFWALNSIKKGYHGVQWVLSRFDLDCPRIPEMFEDAEGTIFTNEEQMQSRMRNKHMTSDDPYLQVRTMSEAEARLVHSPQRHISLRGKLPTAPDNYVDVAANDVFDDMRYRMLPPEDFTEEELVVDDEYESEFGGLLYGTSKGYPDGMDAETAERDPSKVTWHPNLAVEDTNERATRRKMAAPSSEEGKDRWQQAMSRYDHDEAPDACSAYKRWVQDSEGNWVRNSVVAEPPAQDFTAPPPGLAGNDY